MRPHRGRAAPGDPYAEPGALVQGKDVDGDLALDADVVVVGSGAGGGAAAYELARAGLDVLVLEEGGYYRTQDFGAESVDAIKSLFRDGGTSVIFGRPDIMFTEGRAVGGSTVINGGICWRTPPKILKRWLWEHGLPQSLYAPEQLAPVFEEVERILNVGYQADRSIGEDARRIERGARALGYRTSPVRRNQSQCMGTNNCVFGCPTGAKQSTLVSYLPRAVAHGARIHADTRALRVRVDRAGRATGVDAVTVNPWTGRSHRCTVRSRAVVLAAGAVQTPVLLQASRLGNRQVGRNLLVHPNTKAVAIFEEDIVGWKGTIQGWQVDEFIEEGLLLATTFVPPSTLAMSLPHIGPESMEVMRHFDRMVVAGVLVEDTTSGRVRRGPGGAALMTYRITPQDVERLVRGVALLAEIYFAAGARRVLMPFDGVPDLRSPDDIRRLYERRIDPLGIELLTVHAMGTARMDVDPRRGVCGPDGQVHGHPGLHVADASLFPSPIGVNPQITVMALATQVARAVAERVLARRAA